VARRSILNESLTVFLTAIIFIICCICNCSKTEKKPLHTYPFTNSFELPDAIVEDIYNNAFDECVSMTGNNKSDLSKEKIDSICKCAAIGIPYKRYIQDYSLPPCSLVCGKPFSFYCLPKYEWRVPILIDGLDSPVLEYQKVFIRKALSISGDSIWKRMGTTYDDREIKVVHYWYSLKNKVPVFMDLPGYNINIYTIPGFEHELYGIIPTPWTDSSFDYCKPRNPCVVINTMRALVSADTGSSKPLVKLPEAYRNFGRNTR
jgi:hypothetical protein